MEKCWERCGKGRCGERCGGVEKSWVRCGKVCWSVREEGEMWKWENVLRVRVRCGGSIGGGVGKCVGMVEGVGV